ncbi:TPA: hypothetical protein ACKROV_001135 [Providencia alcalifaciens]
MGITALYLAAVLTWIVALLHFACLVWGAAGFKWLGAGERIVKQAQEGHWYPPFTAILVGTVLTIWGLYAFSAAQGSFSLPFTQPILIAISTVFLIRAAIFPLIKSRFKGNSDLFWYVSSGCSLILGALFLVGALLR